MRLAEKENELFKEWRQQRDPFVADGVVDEQAYSESDPKLLFVLKEVNDPGGGGWDLREFLRDGGRPNTWDNIARWILSIRNRPEEIAWTDLESITKTDRAEALRSICAVNLKKSPGGHTTENKDLYLVAARDRDFLRRQFEIYEADLTICCGSVVSELVMGSIIVKPPSAWSTTKRGIRYYKLSDDRYIIDFVHPEARVPDSILNYALFDALREMYP